MNDILEAGGQVQQQKLLFVESKMTYCIYGKKKLVQELLG